MSELRVTTLKHESATADNITLAANGNTITGDLIIQAGNLNVGSVSNFGGLLSVNRPQTSGIASLATFRDGSAGTTLDIETYGDPAYGTVNRIKYNGPYLAIRSGSQDNIRIDSAGRVTMPYQPGFYARRTIANDGRPVGAQEWAVTGLGSYNTGGHFNASNGRFTAPVSGQYIFAAAPGYKQTGQLLSFYYQINGTYMAEPVRLNNETSHGLATGTIVVYLTQGDYVLIQMNGIHHVNVSFNFFTGHLLG